MKNRSSLFKILPLIAFLISFFLLFWGMGASGQNGMAGPFMAILYYVYALFMFIGAVSLFRNKNKYQELSVFAKDFGLLLLMCLGGFFFTLFTNFQLVILAPVLVVFYFLIKNGGDKKQEEK